MASSAGEGVKQIDIHIDRDNKRAGIQHVLQVLRPQWSEDKTEIKEYTGGCLNRSYKITCYDDQSEGLVLRINGPLPPKVGLSRKMEIDSLKHFNSLGVGPRLIATFDNGQVTKWSPGQHLSPCEMGEAHLSNLVARYIARLHHATPVGSQCTAKDGSTCSMLGLARTSMARLRQEATPTDFERYAAELPFDRILEEIDILAKELEELNMPVVLCHNDIWHDNIIYDRPNDKLEIIDYEMCDYNYACFDIASYIVTMTGLPVDPKLVKPTAEVIKTFIKTYLQELTKLEGKDPSRVTEELIETYHTYTRHCMQLFLLTNTPYMLYIGDYQHRTGGYIYSFFYESIKMMYAEYHTLREDMKNSSTD